MSVWGKNPDCGEADLHGFHPYDDDLYDTIKEAIIETYDAGLARLRIIHGHGFDREHYFRSFVNSNTGFLGQTVRRYLRKKELRQWMFAKFDCSHEGSTVVRLRHRT